MTDLSRSLPRNVVNAWLYGAEFFPVMHMRGGQPRALILVCAWFQIILSAIQLSVLTTSFAFYLISFTLF